VVDLDVTQYSLTVTQQFGQFVLTHLTKLKIAKKLFKEQSTTKAPELLQQSRSR
jgi:hypothetical protein